MLTRQIDDKDWGRRHLTNSEPRRITYIHQHFRLPTEAGGTRSWEFARRLAADGHTVTVIAASTRPGRMHTSGFTLIRVPVEYRNEMSTLQRLWAFAAFAVRSGWAAVRTPADVVFATSTPLTVAVPGMLAAFLRRAVFVLEVRDLWPAVPIALGRLRSPVLRVTAQWLEKVAYRRAARVIALSPDMKRGVEDIVPTAEVVMIPNACDFDAFTSDNDQKVAARGMLGWGDKPVAVYAGSLGAIYNIPWLIRLAGHATRVRVVILGEGSSANECQQLAVQLGLNPEAILLGPVPKEDVPRYYAAADVILSSVASHPALNGSSINKVFDAMATGRPVAFNHGGWLSDLLVENGAGWRLNNDPKTAASELELLLTRSGLLERAGKRSRSIGERYFARDALYVEFRDAVLGGVPTRTA